MGANLEGIARTYAWFGDRLIAEYGCNSCCYAGAIYTDGSYGGLWLGRQMGGQKQYPVYDSIGTVHQVVNETPAVLFTNDLDAFGHAIAGSGSATWHPYRFGGAWGYTHMPSGLEQLGARFYWPELGRFIQQDPMGDGVNWYGYVGNNPLTGIDPDGRYPAPVHRDIEREAAQKAGGTFASHAETIASAGYWIDYDPRYLGGAPHFSGAQWAQDKMDEAVNAYLEGKTDDSMRLLGEGAHGLADSIAHRGLSPWEHAKASAKKSLGLGPDPEPISEEVQDALVQATADYFGQFSRRVEEEKQRRRYWPSCQ